MQTIREEIFLTGNPFSREYRQALLEVVRSLNALDKIKEQTPKPKPSMFIAELTDSTPILANRVWKYSWTEKPGGRSSTGGADDYQFFALNGAEVNNPAEASSGGSIVEARASFGVRVGSISDPPSEVTLIPLTEGPSPYVVMHEMPQPVTVEIGGTDYDCFYWFHAANQVDVACG